MEVRIAGKDRIYEIIQKKGALDEIDKYLKLDRNVLIVTDTGVPEEYAKKVAEKSAHPVVVTIEQGEKSKNAENFFLLLETMLRNDFTRNDAVVAVGGGVCGDLAAFAASTYMRGICFYNVPTTLLAMVDSSIGGKTAIDFNGVKNVIGTFYQPSAVVIDTEVLKTLSPRLINAGLAEVIKMAATLDAETFAAIERSTDLNADMDQLISRAYAMKRFVVENDPEEKGLRRVLNFGHTVGHAIESRHGGELLHGECVALGMTVMCSPNVRKRLVQVLEKYDLPTEITDDMESLAGLLKHDKKADREGVNVVLCDEIGSYRIKRMTVEEIAGLTLIGE